MRAVSGHCSFATCRQPGAEWRPKLLLYAPAKYGATPPAQAVVGVFVCDSCKALAKPEDIISNEGWAKIETLFKAMQRAVPVRSRTRLEWVRAADYDGPTAEPN